MRKYLLVPLILLWLPAVASAATLSKPGNNLGLVGYWSLNEGAGTIAHDFSGHGSNGAISGSAWTPGKLGNALKFPGHTITDYVQVSNFSFPTTAVTESFWIKASSGGYGLVGYEASGNPNEFLLYDTSNLTLYANGATVNSGVSIGDNTWHFITVTWQSSGAYTLYKDGVSISSGTLGAGALAPTGCLMFGQEQDSPCGSLDANQALSGSIDEVRIYNRVLSSTEVTALYQAGYARDTSLNSNGLKGYWNFNEGSGSTLKNFIGGGVSGTIYNSPTWVTGKQGYALDFNGTTQYAELPLTVTYPAITVSAWFKADSLSVSNSRIVANAHTDSATDHTGFQLMFNTGGATGFFDVGNGTTEGRAAWTQTLSTGVWYNYVGTYDGATVKSYINGVQVGSGSMTGAIANSGNNISIARNKNVDYTGDYFPGTVDDVRIYNRALSAAEVAAMYTANIPAGKTSVNTSSANLQDGSSLNSGLVGLWTFDGADLTSTVAKDKSGGGNDGTLTSSPKPTIGKLGQGLNLNGSSSYVNAGNVQNLTGPMTLSAWVKLNSLTNGQTIICKAEGGAYCMEFGIQASGKFGWNPYINGSYHQAYADAAAAVGVWYLVTGTYDGSTVRLYVNGVQQSVTNSVSGSITTTTVDLAFGANPGPSHTANNFLNGTIDDVRMYSRALSASEVKQLYNMGK